MATNFNEVRGSFKNCYINGNKARVWSYENGKHVIGYFSNTLSGEGRENAFEELKAAGVSLHGCNNAIWAPGITAEKINEIIPGAEIWWPGSAEYEARVSAATGSRPGGGNNTGKTSAGATAPTAPAVVASSDSFVVPGVDEVPELASVLSIMPALVGGVNEWAASVASSVLDNSECPELPENVAGAAALVPSLSPALDTYKAVITRAATDWMEKKAAAERAEAERLAALEAAKRAAESGKTLVKLFDGSTVEVTGKVHPAFAEVLEDLKEYKAVYLYGPAGTGKSFMARQLAEALGVECYISGKSDLKYDLIGAADVNGKHMFTAFTRAWIDGGVWLWDEWDRSAADACTAINDALANGRLDIPGLGMVERNKDFYCVAAGNTCGFGADPKYSAAQKQDYSAGTRFLSKIFVDYCREMDEIVTDGDKELCDFAAAVRDAIKATGLEIDLAIRSLKPLQTKAARRGCVRALECCLFSGLDKTALRQLSARCDGSNKWFEALKELAA